MKLTRKQKAERCQAIESVTDALDEFDIDASENQIIAFFVHLHHMNRQMQ